eukprot:5148316-Amphidinium_carterae.1
MAGAQDNSKLQISISDGVCALTTAAMGPPTPIECNHAKCSFCNRYLEPRINPHPSPIPSISRKRYPNH